MSAPFMARLWATPPALRAVIFRRAILSQHGLKPKIGAPQPERRFVRVLTGAHAYRIPTTPFISRERRRSHSTSAASLPRATSSEATPKPPLLPRFLKATALVAVFFTIGLAMSAAPAAETANGIINPTSDAETLTLYHPSTLSQEDINDHIVNHPLAVKLRADPNMDESRPHMRIPPGMRPLNLTAGTLLGDDKIAVPPLYFSEKNVELPTMVSIMYLGTALCGHPGIVHGGMLATMLDEGLARACFPALPNKIGVTASLKIDYRVPCPAGNYMVLKAQTTKVEGRKAWAKGWIEILNEDGSDGTKVVEAEGLFIEPKNAKHLMKNIVASE